MMDKYTETFATWNKVASLYEEKFMDLYLYDETYSSFAAAVPELDSTLLEVGCGPGNIAKYLLKFSNDFKLTGIDVAPNMIELAQKNNPTATFKVMDCRNIRSLDTHFDGIIAGFCLPYLAPEDGEKFVYDCAQLLNEFGVFYVSFVEGDPEHSGYKTGSSGDRTYFYYYQLDTVEEWIRAYGLSTSKVYRIPYPTATGEETHLVIIAKKFY